MNIFIAIIYSLILVIQLIVPYVSKEDIFFGVRIPEEAFNNADLSKIKNKYYILVLSLGIPITAGLTYITLTFSNPILMTIGVLALIFIYYGIYIYCNKRTLELKKSMKWQYNNKQTVTIDTTFSKVKNTKSLASPWWFLIPLAIIAVNVLVAYIYYPHIPQTMVKHYNQYGIADAWKQKSSKTIYDMPIVMTILTLIMYVAYKIIGWSKQQINSKNPTESLEKNKRFRYLCSIYFLIISTLLNIMFTFINFTTIGLIKVTSSNIMVFPFVICILIIVSSIVISIYAGQGGSKIRLNKNSTKDSENTDRNDDSYWKFGIFYVNRDDLSLFIEKRFGVGWTINFGRPIIVVFFCALVGIILILHYIN